MLVQYQRTNENLEFPPMTSCLWLNRGYRIKGSINVNLKINLVRTDLLSYPLKGYMIKLISRLIRQRVKTKNLSRTIRCLVKTIRIGSANVPC